jgi:hypothetical protein
LLGLKTQQHLPGFPTRATGNGGYGDESNNSNTHSK